MKLRQVVLEIDRMRLFLAVVLAGSFLVPAFAQDYDSQGSGDAKARQYFRQGLMAERAGDKMHAVEFYRKAAGISPNMKEAHYALGKVSAELGNNDDAESEFRQALNIQNNYVECRNDYGMYLKKRGQVEAAAGEFRKCIETNPKYPFPYYNLALILKDKGDLEGAIENFETTVRLKPDFAEGQRDLGLAIFERANSGDLTTAVETLEKSARLAPNNPKVHYYLGFIYATKGNLDAAEAEYRKALMCDQRMAAAHFELGRLRYLRGDLDRAIAEIREAQRVNPSYTAQRNYPGVNIAAMKTMEAQCLEFKGQLAQAIETYNELVRIRGSNVLYAKHIQDLEKQIKQIERERRKKPLTYDPEEVDALVSKGIEQYEDGALDGAKASFERACQLNPTSLEALMNLSAVQEAQGDLNSALATNRKAMEAHPAFDGAYYNMAYLLEKMNLPSDAGVLYDRFRAIAGKYPYDPQHVIELQQDLIRQQKIEQAKRSRGY
ncbi:MAG: tetratricopeptide repeat protein [Candidatus Obscuribacterales bacterium]|nr:tetratricopeptide repeat protein [Candidatus Obscuribacterales bacterium]